MMFSVFILLETYLNFFAVLSVNVKLFRRKASCFYDMNMNSSSRVSIKFKLPLSEQKVPLYSIKQQIGTCSKPIRISVRGCEKQMHKRVRNEQKCVRNVRTRSDLLVRNAFENSFGTHFFTVRFDMGMIVLKNDSNN